MAIKMHARRYGSDYWLWADNYQIGRLADCEACHVFISDDEELEGFICHRIEGDMSLSEMLYVVRTGYEAFSKYQADVSKSEHDAENAWLRAAEYDPESADQMYREDAAGLS